MKNILQRLLIFLVALPLLFVFICLLPQKNHLAINLVTAVFCTLGAVEFAAILRRKNMYIHRAEAAIFGALPPLAMIMYISFGWTPFLVPSAMFLCTAYCLISCAFAPSGKLEGAVSRVAAGFSVILYPGVFLGCIILISRISNSATLVGTTSIPISTILILTYILIVLINDSFAWLFGMLFGKNNKGIVAASPNKSIVGFAAGIASSIALGVAAAVYFPDAFRANPEIEVILKAKFSPISSGIILGLTTGVASTLGDLAESALKRSAGVKDSGNLMLGRGGVLDCVDSLSTAAPVFFIVYNVLFVIK